MPLAIIVHGGTGSIPESLRPAHAEGIAQALEAGIQALQSGASALDAVIAATVVLENLPAFNAGYGSVLNRAGFIEMDAGIMDGTSLDVGAVAAVRGIRNPILAARHVLATPQILFAKDDGERIAREARLQFVDPDTLITPRRREQWQANAPQRVDSGLESETVADTVGAVALDAHGNMAAATSTGGMYNKPVGRIGDSPLPGGGFYADSRAGACSTTGWGETIARVLLARRAIEGVELGLDPQQAAERAVAFLIDRIPNGEGGLILLTPDGRIGATTSAERMTHASWSDITGERRIVA